MQGGPKPLFLGVLGSSARSPNPPRKVSEEQGARLPAQPGGSSHLEPATCWMLGHERTGALDSGLGMLGWDAPWWLPAFNAPRLGFAQGWKNLLE